MHYAIHLGGRWRHAAFKAQRFYKSHFDALVKHHAEAANLHKRIGSHEAQALAEKVFNALNEWVLGKRGRPRFKGHKRPLHSIQDVFGDGRGVVDRDVYSAFLARNCDETTYNPPRLELAWRALENALVQSGLFLPSTSRREGETARLSDTVEKQIHTGTITPLSSERFDCET
ncbi:MULTISPECIES: hypothetical protein [unclassified Methylobacter]|uniref:hypothetical protein n=1 Tax=unclassified Methylobacter TaxID=2635283 RepID=UPI001893EFEA|nr:MULTISPECIES: hypothetical protein [unclassified Methylobacter]MBF6650043.1 hypothetical protein [Methylobacter sp. BlB1]WAK04361.1 hypothetical protein LZ558_22095 [Methylobacter sp. YRD-M1]